MAMWELIVARGGIEIGVVVVWSVVAVTWLLWAIMFYVIWRCHARSRYSGLASIVRWMLAGTFAEMLIASPVYAFVEDPDDCFCARGSFLGLCIGLAAILWIFGPGIVLLFLLEQQRRLRSGSLCLKCGYDLHGTFEAGRNTCPECGAIAE